MRKWIVAAGLVAVALVVVIVVTKPWPRAGDGGAAPAADEEAMARLRAVNEKAKAASRKLKEERAKVKPFDPGAQRAPYPGQGSSGEAEAEEDGHEHGGKKREPADLERHEKANDVVKATPFDMREEPVVRPDAKPRWDAVAKLEWKRLGTLFTGFSIGYKVGGDFTAEVVSDLHGAAVEIEGAVLPIDPPAGALKRFWLVKHEIAEDGCLFCKEPSPGDLIYVDASRSPLKLDAADREKMYKDTFVVKVVGRFLLGPAKTKDGIEHLWGLELKEVR